MKQKILVIDDDPSLRRVLEYNLEEDGYEVSVQRPVSKGCRLLTNTVLPW